MKRTYNEYRDFAIIVAEEVSLTINKFYKNSKVDYKEDGSEVTVADKKAEEIIRERISSKFQGHQILGEEFGKAGNVDSEYVWIIDPIDGTTWFTLGVPIFGTLIALLENGKPVAGVIHFPMLNETLYAAKGTGCWLKSNTGYTKRVYVDNKEGIKLSNSIVSASGAHKTDIQPFNNEQNYNLVPLVRESGKFRFCGDCLQHSLIAQGRIHVAVDTIMQPWDSAAIIPCIEEAGGIATTISGQKDNIVFGGSLVTSCNSGLHEEVIEILNS